MKGVVNKSLLQKFLFNRWGVSVSDVLKHFSLDKSRLPEVKRLLDDLVRDGWVVESYSCDEGVTEYDPGALQGY